VTSTCSGGIHIYCEYGHLVSADVRADSIAVDWLGRNLYWIDGVTSKIIAIRLAKGTVKSVDHSVILDEDLDQPRSLALLPQKGSALLYVILLKCVKRLKSCSVLSLFKKE